MNYFTKKCILYSAVSGTRMFCNDLAINRQFMTLTLTHFYPITSITSLCCLPVSISTWQMVCVNTHIGCVCLCQCVYRLVCPWVKESLSAWEGNAAQLSINRPRMVSSGPAAHTHTHSTHTHPSTHTHTHTHCTAWITQTPALLFFTNPRSMPN